MLSEKGIWKSPDVVRGKMCIIFQVVENGNKGKEPLDGKGRDLGSI